MATIFTLYTCSHNRNEWGRRIWINNLCFMRCSLQLIKLLLGGHIGYDFDKSFQTKNRYVCDFPFVLCDTHQILKW